MERVQSKVRDKLPSLTGFRFIAAVALAMLSAYFAARSLFLAIVFERALAFGDQWVFVVRDWFDYIDGRYRWTELFSLHNEHRIPTVRLVLFVDALLFNMKGWLPLAIQYLSLAAIAASLARLATDTREAFYLALLPAIAMMWSISQYVNLSWAFQVAFPFVHLFAIGSLAALTRALTQSRWVIWISLACLLDFLAINSLASGLLLIGPALLIAVSLRTIDRRIWVFAAIHLLFVVWYFIGYPPPGYGNYIYPDAWGVVSFVVSFLGVSTASYGAIAGMIGILALVVAALILIRNLILGKQNDLKLTILLAVAAFAFLEAVMAAVPRTRFGVSPRYCTVSIVFFGALLGFYFRQSTAIWARLAVIAASALFIAGTNVSYWDTQWHDRTRIVDQATVEFGAGQFRKETIDRIWTGLHPEWASRYVSLKLGPY